MYYVRTDRANFVVCLCTDRANFVVCLFTLGNRMVPERVLMPSVKTHQTVLNRSVLRRTVLPQIGGPQWPRTVPSASINKTAQV